MPVRPVVSDAGPLHYLILIEAAECLATGTLGVLVRGAQLRLVDLTTAFSRLRTTNFRCRPELLDATLAKYGGGLPSQ